MNAIGMQITTPTGLTRSTTSTCRRTRLFTNRMKLGEFDPDATVPWLTQAVARDQSYGVYPWSTRQRADRDAGAARAGARGRPTQSLVLLKNATITRKDGSTGKLLPIAVPPTGAFKVLVARLLREQLELLPRRLLVDPERARGGERGHGVRGHQGRDPGDRPGGAGRLPAGLHGHGHERRQLLHDDRPGGRRRRRRATTTWSSTPAWTRGVDGTTAPRTATARRSRCPGLQGQLIARSRP